MMHCVVSDLMRTVWPRIGRTSLSSTLSKCSAPATCKQGSTSRSRKPELKKGARLTQARRVYDEGDTARHLECLVKRLDFLALESHTCAA